MVEISDTTVLLVLVTFVFGISTIFIVTHYRSKTRQTDQNEMAKGVKGRAVKGQEDAVETLKDLTAESIKFLKETNNDLRVDNKRLKSSAAYYKRVAFGTGELDGNDLEGTPNTSIQPRSKNGVSEDIVQMRLRMIADKIKIPPELLMFEDVNAALSEIASSPDFDKIAATALKSSSSNEGASDGKIPGITYV